MGKCNEVLLVVFVKYKFVFQIVSFRATPTQTSAISCNLVPTTFPNTIRAQTDLLSDKPIIIICECNQSDRDNA